MNKLRRQKHITPLRLQCCLTWRNPAASGLRKLKPSTQGACDTHGLGAHGVRSTTSQTLRGLKPQHKHCCCNPRRRRGPDSTPTVTRLVCTDVSNARSSCVHETENFSGRLRRRTKKQPHSHLASLPGATRGARTVRSLLRVSLRAARGPEAVTAACPSLQGTDAVRARQSGCRQPQEPRSRPTASAARRKGTSASQGCSGAEAAENCHVTLAALA